MYVLVDPLSPGAVLPHPLLAYLEWVTVSSDITDRRQLNVTIVQSSSV